MRYLLVVLLLSWNTTISREINSIDNLSPRFIFFAFNSSEYLNPADSTDYKSEYAALKSVLDSPELILEIHGFQNNKEKKQLAEQRASMVRLELIKIGFNKSQLITIAEPIVMLTGSMEQIDKQMTQRVEFRVQVLK